MTRYMKFMTFLVLAAKMAMAGSDHVALTGDGSNSGLSIAPSGFKLTSTTYTVEAWVWPSTLQSEGPIMDQFIGNSNQGDWSFVVYAQSNDKGKLGLLSRGVVTDKSGGPWFVSASALPVSKWSHVAVAVDGSTIKFYINGKLDATHTITSGSTLPTSSGTFRIGAENRGSKPCFNGKLSDCRVWSVARTAEEIAGNRFVRLAGTEQGLAAYWQLDEGSGSSVTNKVTGTADTITGSTYGWTDMRTPFTPCDVPPTQVVMDESGEAARISTGGFKIEGEAFSMECWVCPITLAKVNAIFSQFNENSESVGDLRFAIMNNGHAEAPSRLGFFYRGFGEHNWTYGKNQVPLYKWTHVAVTCDGDEAKVYLDGLLETSVVRTAESRIVPSSSTLYLLGLANWNQWMNGSASDLRVWDRALSADEIASNRFSRLAGQENGLVGYWPLAETEGTVATNYAGAALMGYGGTLSARYSFVECAATPFVERSGGMDDACVLSGGSFDTQMRIWHPSYTVEAWIRLNGHDNNVVFSQFKDFSGGDLRMTVNNQGKLSGFLRNFIEGNWVYSTGTVPLNVWTHVALSYDGQKMKLYINGVKDSEFDGNTVAPNGTAHLYAGGTEDGTLGFNGRLSDLRVWDTVRTDEEIAANYASRLTGAEPHLQGYWPLGQSSGSTVFNYSRQGVADGAAAGTLTWLSGASTPFHSPRMMIIIR